MSEQLTTDRLVLNLKDVADFDIDKDGDLCIGIDSPGNDTYICTWLNREEGQQLLDLLTRWLK